LLVAIGVRDHAVWWNKQAGRALMAGRPFGQEATMLSTVLIVILILVLIGALPTWPYSSGWGYGPGGLVGVILIVVLVLALMGRV
jgi:peptidoglycan/LPS O-acetylase OafA/YrhL